MLESDEPISEAGAKHRTGAESTGFAGDRRSDRQVTARRGNLMKRAQGQRTSGQRSASHEFSLALANPPDAVVPSVLWALAGTSAPSTAQESIWNLRTPEWEAVWPTMADAEESRQRLIRIASELIGYSGKLLPVQPVSAASQSMPFRSGHVPIDTALARSQRCRAGLWPGAGLGACRAGAPACRVHRLRRPSWRHGVTVRTLQPGGRGRGRHLCRALSWRTSAMTRSRCLPPCACVMRSWR